MSGNLDNIFGDAGQEATAEEYSAGGSVLPPGKHKVVITEAELKDNSKKNGKLIAFVFEADAGNVWEYVNIANPNEQCQNIDRATLAKIATCCGVKNLTTTDQLIGQELVLKVNQFEDTYNGKTKIKNAIKGYFPASEPTGVEPKKEESKTDTPW